MATKKRAVKPSTNKPAAKLSFRVMFDLTNHPDSFEKFVKALLQGGFEPEIRLLAKELAKEAKRRGLSIPEDFRAVMRKSKRLK